ARVDRCVVNRIQDAGARGLPFQQKIGAGMTTEQFQKQVADGSVRHVGFTESIAMIADALGWTLDRIPDNVEPKLATVTTSSEFLAVDPGYVCGIVQEGVGYRKGEPAIRLHMEAYLGAPETYDSIEIEGSARDRLVMPRAPLKAGKPAPFSSRTVQNWWRPAVDAIRRPSGTRTVRGV